MHLGDPGTAGDAGLPGWATVLCGLASGSVAFWVVGLVLTQMYRLKSEGNLQIRNSEFDEATRSFEKTRDQFAVTDIAAHE